MSFFFSFVSNMHSFSECEEPNIKSKPEETQRLLSLCADAPSCKALVQQELSLPPFNCAFDRNIFWLISVQVWENNQDSANIFQLEQNFVICFGKRDFVFSKQYFILGNQISFIESKFCFSKRFSHKCADLRNFACIIAFSSYKGSRNETMLTVDFRIES